MYASCLSVCILSIGLHPIYLFAVYDIDGIVCLPADLSRRLWMIAVVMFTHRWSNGSWRTHCESVTLQFGVVFLLKTLKNCAFKRAAMLILAPKVLVI